MRNAYTEQLEAIVADLVHLTDLVQTSVRRATEALLRKDAAIAEEVISGDRFIDDARERIENASFEVMSLQQPVAGDLRMLIATLRMVVELERMGDLSVHIAKIARLRIPDAAVPESMEPVLERMGTIAELMVGKVGHIIEHRDVDEAHLLESIDEEMDQLRRRTFREVLDSSWDHGVEPAIDIALLGRYYERIADHAVSIARRVVFLVTGENIHHH